jgi:DNA repair exonuclease SbcCD ATPase subunit
MTKIIKVKAEGFGSIVDKIKYKFNRPGLNVITGENGAGKSTIIGILRWCLFGIPLKPGSSIESWNHIGNDSGVFSSVDLIKDKSKYRIIRCQKYKGKIDGKRGGSQLLVFKDGEIMQLKGKVETQKFIINLLGYSDTLFKAAIIFGQETKRLMEEDGPAKKKILEEAFEASFITRAKEIVEERLSTLLQEQAMAERDYQIKKVTLKASKESYGQQKQLEENFEADKRREIQGIKEEERLKKIPLIEKWVKQTEQKLIDYKPDESLTDQEFRAMLDYNNAQEQVEKTDRDIAILKKELLDFAKNKPCPTCGQKLTPEAKKKYVAELRSTISRVKSKRMAEQEIADAQNKEWEGLKLALSSLQADRLTYQNIKDHLKKLEGLRKDLEDTQKDILYKDKEIKKLRLDIAKVKNRNLHQEYEESAKNKRIIVATNRVLLKTAKEEYRKIAKKVKIDRWLINDPLSNSGLKAYIFDTMLSKLNHKLKRYTHDIGFTLRVYIDMDSARKDVGIDILQKGEIIPYNDLSKGQKQLANVALIFGIHDTVTENKPINILVLDEIFESLSKSNVEKVSNLLQRLAKKKSIHLITHLPDFQPINAYRTEVTLNEKGHTKITQKFRDS